MDSTKLSVALLEVFCALGFVVCGVVVGFSFGGLIGPRLLGHGQGLAEVGPMLTGVVVGAVLGSVAAVVAIWRLPRSRRQRFATSALALGALTALFTALAVQHFSVW
jgi:hypothetical protein